MTTLSTMLASRGIGEWGYAALIEVDNKKILFDTGNRPGTVLKNAEDLSLVIDTKQGFVLVSGCGHAGVINTMEHINNHIHPGKITTAIGGFHLVSANDEHLAWTATKMQSFGLTNLIGAHCTGIDALYSIRALLKSDRKHIHGAFCVAKSRA